MSAELHAVGDSQTTQRWGICISSTKGETGSERLSDLPTVTQPARPWVSSLLDDLKKRHLISHLSRGELCGRGCCGQCLPGAQGPASKPI